MRVTMFIDNNEISSKEYPSREIAAKAMEAANSFFTSEGMGFVSWKMG